MTYGLIIIFGAFVVLLIINPNLSCFGKRITSPLYPLLRHKKRQSGRIKTDDYGFRLSDSKETHPVRKKNAEDEEFFLDQFENKKKKAKDYGFHLGENEEAPEEDAGSGRD